MVTDEMVEKAANAIAEKCGYAWPGNFDSEEIKIGRENMRVALEAALSAAEQQTAPSVAGEIADAVLSWMVEYDLLDAGNEYRAAEVIAVLDDFKPSYHAALSAQVQDVAELDEKTIVRLAWENFSESDYGRLTYERAPPMFPQAKYDVPTYALSQFVKAVLAAAPAKQEG